MLGVDGVGVGLGPNGRQLLLERGDARLHVDRRHDGRLWPGVSGGGATDVKLSCLRGANKTADRNRGDNKQPVGAARDGEGTPV